MHCQQYFRIFCVRQRRTKDVYCWVEFVEKMAFESSEKEKE